MIAPCCLNSAHGSKLAPQHGDMACIAFSMWKSRPLIEKVAPSPREIYNFFPRGRDPPRKSLRAKVANDSDGHLTCVATSPDSTRVLTGDRPLRA
eukprot:TRINITY_DN15824_c0_g1_i1.p1 TRINITY_DN15824_c0_g1~~TRINITY_DN15824_c0_g1_i1.p1  ORF type:complete len:107 (+),score=6.98 TRINITY_DN15824_c0_g1_i1:39-323(+)